MAKNVVSTLLIYMVLLTTYTPILASAAPDAISPAAAATKEQIMPMDSQVSELSIVILEALSVCTTSCTEEKCGGGKECLPECKKQCDISKVIPVLMKLVEEGIIECMEPCVLRVCPNVDAEQCFTECYNNECHTKRMPAINTLLYAKCMDNCIKQECGGSKDDTNCLNRCGENDCGIFRIADGEIVRISLFKTRGLTEKNALS